MYLDKPLRAHTLFQAVCRTNRRWTNPHTGQEKLHGLIVDYVGIGKDLAKALATKPIMRRDVDEADTAVLMAVLVDAVELATGRFTGVDRTQLMFDQALKAQSILETQEARNEFAAEFMRCQGLFEFLWPDIQLRAVEDDYKFLANVYMLIAPTKAADLLLWHRLGAKTMEIVHEHLTQVTIDAKLLESVAMDAGLLEVLQGGKLFPFPPAPGRPAPTAMEVLLKLEERIRKRMAGGGVKVWQSLIERLEMLRLSRIGNAQESVDFLKMLLELAKDLLAAERADDEGRIDEVVVVDPRRGALTQIFNEFKPDGVPVIIENVVEQVDSLVNPVKGTKWQTSHPGDREVRLQLRLILHNNGLQPDGELFDRAYAYIKENY
jgi:type I restriction enzyme R subunit